MKLRAEMTRWTLHFYTCQVRRVRLSQDRGYVSDITWCVDNTVATVLSRALHISEERALTQITNRTRL